MTVIQNVLLSIYKPFFDRGWWVATWTQQCLLVRLQSWQAGDLYKSIKWPKGDRITSTWEWEKRSGKDKEEKRVSEGDREWKRASECEREWDRERVWEGVKKRASEWVIVREGKWVILCGCEESILLTIFTLSHPHQDQYSWLGGCLRRIEIEMSKNRLYLCV